MRKFSLSSWLTVILSLAVLSFIVFPFLTSGIFFGHDIFLHLVYVQKFYEAAIQGQMPVRIIDWIFPGFDQPLFTFYQPGFYYVTLIFKLLHFSTIDSIKIVSLSLWIVGFAGMFLFVKRKTGLAGGFVASLLYTFAPYHIVDIFVRSAFPEFAALSIVPFVFLGIDGLLTSQNRIYWWMASISIAVLLLFHPPTALMFLPLVVLYCLYFLMQKDIVRNSLKLLLVGSVGFLISSFFLLPAFFERQVVFLQKATQGNYNFYIHFVCFPQLFKTDWGYGFSIPGCNDTMPFSIGTLHILFVIAAIIFMAVFLLKKQWRRELWLVSIFIAIFFFSLFMTGFWSKVLWEKIPFLSFLQFPWRFLAVSIFTASFLGGYVLQLLPENLRFRFFIAILAGICLLYFPYVRPLTYFSQEAIPFDKNGFTNYEEFVTKKYIPEPFYDPTTAQKIDNPTQIDYAEISLQNKGKIVKKTNDAAKKIFVIDSPTNQQVTIFVRYVPGWEVIIDTMPVHFSVDVYGYLHASVTKGTHTITAFYTQTQLEKVSNTISILAFIASFFFFIPFKRKLRD